MQGPPEDHSYLLIANGIGDGPPLAPFREWLVQRGAEVTVVMHPLTAEDVGEHLQVTYRGGVQVAERRVRLPSHPPFTYPLDLLAPVSLPPADLVIAFNNLHAARALMSRPRRTVVYSAVDFVPDRFGRGTSLTRAYEAVDRWVCKRVAARFEVSEVALQSRDQLLRLTGPTHASVVPLGAWLKRVPQVPEDAHRRRRVVFMGHLVERMGVETLLQALALLRDRGVEVSTDVAGRGPSQAALQELSDQLGLTSTVRFHGFIRDHHDLERLLAEATVAVAPYSTRVDSFTRFADPGKLKSYLAAGLPILVTDVPPNARELASAGGAEVIADTPEALAHAIERLLSDEQAWRDRRAAALSYVRQFDWDVIIPNALAAVGIA